MNNNKLIDLCVDIFAHAREDWEYTTRSGNGINSSEAAEVAMDILEVLDIKYDTLKDAIETRVRDLREYLGVGE